MITIGSFLLRGFVCALFTALATGTALAGSHTWDVNEVFSDATGNVQFIELVEANGTPNETGVAGHTLSSDLKSFVIPGAALTPPTSNKFFLIATAAFAALPGAPTPDALIPPDRLPFFFSPSNGDTIDYQPWDSLSFGAGVVPTDGINSLRRNLSTGANSPTNYAGVTGSVNAAPEVPSVSRGGMLVLAACVLLIGCALGAWAYPARRSVAPRV